MQRPERESAGAARERTGAAMTYLGTYVCVCGYVGYPAAWAIRDFAVCRATVESPFVSRGETEGADGGASVSEEHRKELCGGEDRGSTF